MADELVSYGWDPGWAEALRAVLSTPAGAVIEDPEVGRVIRHDGAGLMVATAAGPVRAMFGPAVDPPPVVGDWVVVDRFVNPRATLPRRSLLRRRAAGGEGEQNLVANLDMVLIVCGLDRPVRPGRIQRTLTLAHDAGAEALVVLTKADLVEVEVVEAARAAVTETDAGLDAMTVSVASGAGIALLLERIGTGTVALIGESGAGKSTLVNALLASEVAETASVRSGDGKGRHTTTSRELHRLSTGGVLVDTPGIREVGVFVDQRAVAETFADVDELAGRCRFNDCSHRTEPGCAVMAAVAAGDLDPRRLERWRQIESEASAAAERQERAARLRRR